jgi:hypothetical protein
VLSADGSGAFFASSATQLVHGGTSGQQLFCRSQRQGDDTLPELLVAPLPVEGEHCEEDSVSELTLPWQDAEGDAVVCELADELSSAGATVTLLPPTVGRPSQRLRFEPPANFCGEDMVRLRLWDGSEWTQVLEQKIVVSNVNDAPQWKTDTPWRVALTEGEQTEIELDGLATDVDVSNPPPFADQLRFGMEGASTWMFLDGSVLDMSPGMDAITRDESPKTFVVNMTVTDQAGATAMQPLQVVLTNHNRAPVLGTQEFTWQEGIAVPWEALGAHDDDAEDDDDALRLCLAGIAHGVFQCTEKGTWRTLSAADCANGVAKAQFPIRYLSDGEQLNEIVGRVCLKDPEQAASAWSNVTIQLQRVEFSLLDLWQGKMEETGIVWEGLRKGWNLLAFPCAVSGDELERIFGEGAMAWVWKEDHYEAVSAVKAEQGFWIYVTYWPSAIAAIGSRDFSKPRLQRGWNLVGAGAVDVVEGKENDVCGFALEDGRLFVRTIRFVSGYGYWLWSEGD